MDMVSGRERPVPVWVHHHIGTALWWVTPQRCGGQSSDQVTEVDRTVPADHPNERTSPA